MQDITNNRQYPLESSELEKDLGVHVSNDLKPHEHTSKAASKANSILGQLKRTFVSRGTEIWKKLYITYVRPHLEFAIAACNPQYIGDQVKLEKVQHRATRMPFKMKDKSYDARCQAMGLQKLTDRRVRGDLIQQYKIQQGIDEVNWHCEPKFSKERGGHRPHMIKEVNLSCRVRDDFFNNRVAKDWNSLPDEVVNAASVNSFKSMYDDPNRRTATRAAR
jgi:hypothetical protein